MIETTFEVTVKCLNGESHSYTHVEYGVDPTCSQDLIEDIKEYGVLLVDEDEEDSVTFVPFHAIARLKIELTTMAPDDAGETEGDE